MAIKYWLIILLSFSLSACGGYGWIYTNVTEPVVTDMKNTRRGEKMVELSSHHLREPLTNLRLSAEWRSRAIGDAAKQQGLEEIYYADLQRMSLFGSFYKRESIQVWGK